MIISLRLFILVACFFCLFFKQLDLFEPMLFAFSFTLDGLYAIVSFSLSLFKNRLSAVKRDYAVCIAIVNQIGEAI